MIERTQTRPSGLNRQGLRTWGLLFLVLGVAGQSIVQNQILGIGMVSNADLLAAMEADPNMMGLATLALACQAIEALTVPIFVFMLVEGFRMTANWLHYLGRVLALAVLSEIPYNMAMSGQVLDMQSRNPVFGLALCLLVLYFLRNQEGKGFSKIVIKLFVIVAAILWTNILGIDHGTCAVILSCVLWGMWEKTHFRVFVGCSAVMACCLVNPFYMAAPMSFLAIHFYNGEQGDGNRWVNYLAYPVIMLAFGLAGMWL